MTTLRLGNQPSPGPVRYDQGVIANNATLSDRRLELLEQVLDPDTQAVLEGREPRSSWRCLELGAGRGSVARWLARRCPDGHVTATDLDTLLVDPGDLPNLTVRRHDVATDDFEPGSFDLIHCRAVLIHVAEREEVLRKAARWLAPGGWLVVEDLLISPLGESPYPAFQRVQEGISQYLGFQQATDARWARRIPYCLSGLDLTRLGMNISIYPSGGRNDDLLRITYAQVAPAAIQHGFLTDEDLVAGLALMDDPAFLDVDYAMISAWGRRPDG